METDMGETAPGSGRKSAVLASIIREFRDNVQLRQILVIGCGGGEDAQSLAAYFDAFTDAIDIRDRFRSNGDPRVRFAVMDARRLSFDDASFDLVYSFHALEHIDQPELVISEISRVLRNRGVFCIGVPNKSRLVGYVSGNDPATGRPITWSQKIAWNLLDWKMRLQGRFRNECGAHAGFTEQELMALASFIGAATSASRNYYDRLYSRRRRLVAMLSNTGLWRWAFPCVYVVGRKQPA